MSKTAREGAVEIVRSVSVQEWTQMLNESVATVAETSAAFAELLETFGQTVDEMAVAVSKFRERWAEIHFTD